MCDPKQDMGRKRHWALDGVVRTWGLTFFFWPHPIAYGILVPQPGIESMLHAMKLNVLTAGPSGKSLGSDFERDGKFVLGSEQRRDIKK